MLNLALAIPPEDRTPPSVSPASSESSEKLSAPKPNSQASCAPIDAQLVNAKPGQVDTNKLVNDHFNRLYSGRNGHHGADNWSKNLEKISKNHATALKEIYSQNHNFLSTIKKSSIEICQFKAAVTMQIKEISEIIAAKGANNQDLTVEKVKSLNEVSSKGMSNYESNLLNILENDDDKHTSIYTLYRKFGASDLSAAQQTGDSNLISEAIGVWGKNPEKRVLLQKKQEGGKTVIYNRKEIGTDAFFPILITQLQAEVKNAEDFKQKFILQKAELEKISKSLKSEPNDQSNDLADVKQTSEEKPTAPDNGSVSYPYGGSDPGKTNPEDKTISYPYDSPDTSTTSPDDNTIGYPYGKSDDTTTSTDEKAKLQLVGDLNNDGVVDDNDKIEGYRRQNKEWNPDSSTTPVPTGDLPPKSSFYEDNKAIIWGVGGAAAGVGGYMLADKYLLNDDDNNKKKKKKNSSKNNSNNTSSSSSQPSTQTAQNSTLKLTTGNIGGVSVGGTLPAISVKIVDPQGVDTKDSLTDITVICASPKPCSITGTMIVKAQNGTATFSDLKFTSAHTGVYLQFTAPGMQPVNSTSFDVSNSSSNGSRE